MKSLAGRVSLFANGRRLAVAERGIWAAHRWWVLRRLVQIGALATFMAGPWLGVWVVRGNFAASELLGTVPLADPYIWLQGFLAGAAPVGVGLLGVGLIVALYLVLGGRAYCGWICPVNIVTDAAFWLREKLGISRDRKIDRRTRWGILAATLVASIATGTIAWEFLNPVSALQRGLIFGMGAGWVFVMAVFVLDLLVTRRGWCGHLCPVGAFYGAIGRGSLLRVSAARREDCTHCAACFNVCPEPHVIAPALNGTSTRLILSGDCQNCGACIDSCPVDLFEMTTRLHAEPGQSSDSKCS